MDKREIKDLFDKAGASIAQDDIWFVQNTPVVKHKAVERLGAALKIRFQPPLILRAERDEAVILSTGVLGDATEWSIGEACVNVNYLVKGKMSAYVYAMAEKRSRDRVILKLAGLHGVYSEEEADEFRSNGGSSSQGEMTERIMNAEKLVDAAAEKGIDSLTRIWKQLDPEVRPFLTEKIAKLGKELKEKANASAI